jgi:hypothetical protein
MKRKISLLIFALSFVCSSSVFAHPATAVMPSYDAASKILTVKIIHTSSRPNFHYIYKIEIEVNGQIVVSDDTLKAQTSADGLTYTAPLTGIKDSDTVKVTAICNRSGEKTGTLTISGTPSLPAKSQDNPSSQTKTKSPSRWGF